MQKKETRLSFGATKTHAMTVVGRQHMCDDSGWETTYVLVKDTCDDSGWETTYVWGTSVKWNPKHLND